MDSAECSLRSSSGLDPKSDILTAGSIATEDEDECGLLSRTSRLATGGRALLELSRPPPFSSRWIATGGGV